MTKFYVIRHAEAEGNLYRRIHGWYDSLITPNGYRQIAALEGRFAGESIDAVYSSDLFRTMTTARALYLPHGLPLHTRPSLREFGVGVWEDRTWGDLERREPAMLHAFNHAAPAFQVEGGETVAQVQARMKGTLLELAQAHPGQTVALFSHGAAIRCLQGAVRGLGPGKLDGLGHSDNTAVSCFEVEGEHIRVVFENDNSHLPEEISTLARQRWWKEEGGHLADANMWFRPLDLERERDVYLEARREAWVDIHGPELPFDRAGFLQDALRGWSRDRNRSLFAAMLGDTLAGLLQLDLERFAGEETCFIPFVYMTPRYRKRGLGVQLIGQAVSVYRPLGRKRLRLRCAPENAVAQRFYEKYGFAKAGVERAAQVTLDILEKSIAYE